MTLESGSGNTVPAPTFSSTGLPQSFADNPGTGVVLSQAPDGISITEPAFGSDNINTVMMAYPTPPFVLKGYFYIQQDWQVGPAAGGAPSQPSSGDGYGGLVIRNAGGNLQTCGLLNSLRGSTLINNATTFVINWTNSTTVSTGPAEKGVWSDAVALALADDGTNLTYYYSLNPDAVNGTGYKWHQVYQVAKASNFITTPNKIGIFLSAHASDAELVMTRFSLAAGSSTL